MHDWKASLVVAIIAGSSALAGSYFTGSFLLESNNKQIEAQKEQYKSQQKDKYLRNFTELSTEYILALRNLKASARRTDTDRNVLRNQLATLYSKGTSLMLVSTGEIFELIPSVTNKARDFIIDRKSEDYDRSLYLLQSEAAKLQVKISLFILANRDFEVVESK